MLRGNKDYFSMVIQNLINNAIKYSPADSKILFRVISKNSHTKIFVEDFGIGLSDKDRDRIFERFYRGAAAENSDIPGYGLGLSLVSSIVRSMDGTVDVEKNKPQGTIFIITVPELRTD
ncbi:Sensor-like histidine kinase senX3 [subsurface metagenome]